MTRVYQWGAVRNFGDRLSTLLLSHFANVEAIAVGDPRQANVACVGSVMHHLPGDWEGTILGTGTLWGGAADVGVVPARARVLGVRGAFAHSLLTDGQRKTCISIGDPGLVADELVPPPERVHSLGLLPHWSDGNLWERREFWKYDPLFIDPRSDPLTVISAIGSCNKLVTSSLHGMVLAHAFGIPVRFEMGGRLHREGGTHKHEEHCDSVGTVFEPGVVHEAERFKVNDVRDKIIDMFEQYGGVK